MAFFNVSASWRRLSNSFIIAHTRGTGRSCNKQTTQDQTHESMKRLLKDKVLGTESVELFGANSHRIGDTRVVISTVAA